MPLMRVLLSTLAWLLLYISLMRGPGEGARHMGEWFSVLVEQLFVEWSDRLARWHSDREHPALLVKLGHLVGRRDR